MNINLLSNSSSSLGFLDSLSIISLRQVISEPTRVTCSSESLIDVCIVDNDSSVVNSGTLGFGFSDHLICFAVFNWKTSSPPKKSPSLGRSYKKFNPLQFQNELKVVPWSIMDIFDDIDDKVNVYTFF